MNKLCISFVIGVVFVIVGCSNDSSKQGEGRQLYVAANLPLTGDFATYGKTIQDGVIFATESFPEDELVNIHFDWGDNAGIPKNTVSLFQKQVSKPIDVYISGVKPQTMSIIDLVSERKIPHFVWVFDAFITSQYNYTYRTWVSFKEEPRLFLEYIDKKKAENIAVVYVQLPHTDEEFNDILIPYLGNKKLFIEKFNYELNDFKNIASKIKDFSPDLLILSGFKVHLISMIKTFREYGLITDGNTLCSYDLLDASLEMNAEMIEGLRVVTPFFEITSDSLTSEWKQAYIDRYNRNAKYTDAYAYDMANVIYNVGQRIPQDSIITPEIWNRYLLETDIQGVSGRLSFDTTGDLKVDLRIGKYTGGRLIEDTGL